MELACSIIVPTFNRIEFLKKCLASLVKLNFKGYEIIVVDDACTDGTYAHVKSLKTENLTVIRNSHNLGPAGARNEGIKVAKSKLLAFIDDDCVADPNWLTELMRGFADENIGLVIGQTFYVSRDYKGYFPERLISNKNAHWPMTCNIAYRKSVFEKCGGFNDRYAHYNNEDTEMAIRAVSNGFRFNRVNEAVVFHQKADWTIRSLLASAKNASVWALLKKHYPKHYLTFAPNIKWGIFIDPADYLYFLLLPILLPLLLIRYLMHGKRNLILFFIKWPVLLILKRLAIYKEGIRNGVWVV